MNHMNESMDINNANIDIKSIISPYINSYVAIAPMKSFKRENGVKKVILEKGYTQYKERQSDEVYVEWLNSYTNFLAFCGLKSNLTIIDIDSHDTMQSICNTLQCEIEQLSNFIVKTQKGYQLHYLYDEKLPSKIAYLDSIDILSDNRITFALECNEGYSVLHGNIRQRSVIPDNFRKLLLKGNREINVSHVYNNTLLSYDGNEVSSDKLKELSIPKHGFMYRDVKAVLDNELGLDDLTKHFSNDVYNITSFAELKDTHKKHNFLIHCHTILFHDGSIDKTLHSILLSMIAKELGWDISKDGVNETEFNNILTYSFNAPYQFNKDLQRELKSIKYANNIRNDVSNKVKHNIGNGDIDLFKVPLNMGTEFHSVLQELGTNDYYVFNHDSGKFNHYTQLGFKNLCTNLGLKALYKEIAPFAMKFEFSPHAPQWSYNEKDMVWIYNSFTKSKWLSLYDSLETTRATAELILPPIHKILFNNVCGNDTKAVEYLCSKIKRIVEQRAYSQTYTLLRGVGGSGKSLITRYLGEIVGMEYFKVANAKDFLNNFNTFCHECLILLIEELPRSKEKCDDFFNNIKEIVANPNLTIRRKFKEAFLAKSYLNVFLTTNHNTLYDEYGSRRHSEILSNDIKLRHLPKFRECLEFGGDALELLLSEISEFFISLKEWHNSYIDSETSFINDRARFINNSQKRKGSYEDILIQAIISGNKEGFINACKSAELYNIAMYHNGIKFAIPNNVVDNFGLLQRYYNVLKENNIIVEHEETL